MYNHHHPVAEITESVTETANKPEPGISPPHTAGLFEYHAQDSQIQHFVTKRCGSYNKTN